MRGLLIAIAIVTGSSVAKARAGAEPPPRGDSSAASASSSRRFELRPFAELTRHATGLQGEYEPGERGWAYGLGAEALWRLGSLVAVGAGVSVSAIDGENTDGNSLGDDISGHLLQVPFVVELGFPNVEWGRFFVGLEIGGMQATFKNMYYFAEDRGERHTGGGALLGFRVGYVHWLSDDWGVFVNAAARASNVDVGLYASLSGRVGVSWRLQ